MTSLEDARAKAPAGKTHRHRSEVRDGMRIDWDVPIEMDDGEGKPSRWITLRALRVLDWYDKYSAGK